MLGGVRTAIRTPFGSGPGQDTRDFGTAVAGTDHQDVPPAVGDGRAVAGRVQQGAGECRTPGPMGDVRGVAAAGGHHDRASGHRAVGGVDQPPGARTGLGPLDALHRGAHPDAESVMGDVSLQVSHVVVPAHPRARLARHRQAGEFRGTGGGVQSQMVIALRPARSHSVRPFQDHGRYSGAAQQRGDREPVGTGSDHDRGSAELWLWCGGHRPLQRRTAAHVTPDAEAQSPWSGGAGCRTEQRVAAVTPALRTR